jgi:hypothetical protein
MKLQIADGEEVEANKYYLGREIWLDMNCLRLGKRERIGKIRTRLDQSLSESSGSRRRKGEPSRL